VSLSDRDRKILLALVPLALIAVYWFLILAPKRQEATSIQDQLTQAQAERDTAVQRLAGLGTAKRSFAKDYATVIYLGKSIPTAVDMPSLLVQLDRASRGTGIQFASIKVGARSAAASAGASPSTSGSASTGSTSTTAATGSSSNGLDSVPLDFEFDGSYFDLANFFHRMKRFVRVSNDRIIVRGRLLTINNFSFAPSQGGAAGLTATVHATVYLAPKAQGTSAGATSSGPAAAPASQPAQSASSSSTPPAATVTAR
jgi:Tfp pilus assembly protein PilO